MKKPIYKRVWFWIVVVLVLGGAGLLRDGGGEPEASPAPTADVRAMPESTPEAALSPTAAPTVLPSPTPTPAPTPEPSPETTPEPRATPEPTPTPTEYIHGVPADTIVYVSAKSSTIHKIHDCSGMKNYREMTIAEADAAGYKYCPNCW